MMIYMIGQIYLKKENKKIEEFKSPVVLVDLYEDQMNLYFGKNNFVKAEEKNKFSKNNQKSRNKVINKKSLSINTTYNDKSTLPIDNIIKNHISSKIINNNKIPNNNLTSKTMTTNYIRPMSVYSPRINSCSFYFSSAFSDYYKEDLKTFSEKMKILKVKIKSFPSKLRNEIKTQRNIALQKEIKLKKLSNIEQFNFGKDNLIIAGERKNPIPLLKSIFRQKYPYKDIMKENIKMYYKTMKPVGTADNPVDYTKNERWRLSELIAEMREGKNNVKNNKNRSNYNIFNDYHFKRKNLILKTYNKNDPYIKMFENMIRKNNMNINSFKGEENNDLVNKIFYNPILQNLDDNYSISYNTNLIEDRNEINKKLNIKSDYEIEKNIITNVKNKNIVNIRPKTCYKSVGSYINKTLITRPLTSLFKRYNILYPNFNNHEKRNSLKEDYLDPYSNLEYTANNSFPLKTLSSIGNASYDKINQRLQERQFGSPKSKNDYFITSTGQIKNNLKIKKFKEEKIILEKYNKDKNNILFKNDKNLSESFKKKRTNKKIKINYYNFDNIKDNFIKKKKSENLYSLKYFKNMAGKYYSSSNNVNVKNKRNNKKKLLNNFYTESKYSRDEQDQDIDYVDEAISSQTNSSIQKIL